MRSVDLQILRCVHAMPEPPSRRLQVCTKVELPRGHLRTCAQEYIDIVICSPLPFCYAWFQDLPADERDRLAPTGGLTADVLMAFAKAVAARFKQFNVSISDIAWTVRLKLDGQRRKRPITNDEIPTYSEHIAGIYLLTFSHLSKEVEDMQRNALVVRRDLDDLHGYATNVMRINVYLAKFATPSSPLSNVQFEQRFEFTTFVQGIPEASSPESGDSVATDLSQIALG